MAVTAPYMHDGSVATLRDAVVHYNNGGVTNEGDPVNDFLSGGIRPLDLTDDQIDDLVAFMEALTSPEFASQATAGRRRVEEAIMTNSRSNRRDFLKGAGALAAVSTLPLSTVELAFADSTQELHASPTSPTPTSSTSRAPSSCATGIAA